MIEKKWKNKSVIRLINESENPDPISTIKQRTRDIVLEAFEKGWNGPPFDPFKLARLLEINIVPNDAIQEARILSVNDKFQIEYNPFQRAARINFSISHEIGHTLFSDWSETVRNREDEKTGELWELEFLCNIAASEILLPYAEFAREVNNLPLNMTSLINISEKYQASLEAVFLRFAEVVSKPCAILIAFFEDEEKKKLTVDYFKASSALQFQIENKYLIPKKSKAYECLNSGWTSEGLEKWDIFDNEELKVYSIGLPPLKRQKKQRVGIFIAPEVYDEKPEKDIYKVTGDATQPRGEGNKIIVQLVNTTAGVGFGFGRSMAVNWPLSKKVLYQWKESKDFILGNSKLTQLNADTFVFQILAQKGIRPKYEGEQILSYIGLRKGLEALKTKALQINASIHMPLIGAGQAKGDWNIIAGIIYDELIQNNISVTVYKYPENKSKPQDKPAITLFDT